MEKIYTTLFAMGAFMSSVNAQLTLTKLSNEPVSGDSYSTTQIDSVNIVPKNTGSNQVWNFNGMTILTNSQLITYTNAGSVPASSLYPGSTVAMLRSGGGEVDFYKSSANWEFMGNYDSAGPNVLTLTNTAVFAAWPISYNSTNMDVASGAQTSGTTITTLNGSISYTAQGNGTVIAPGGQIFTNCLQVVTTITISLVTGVMPSPSTQTMIRYDYYAPLRKFPIVSMEYKSTSTGAVVSKNFYATFDSNIQPLGVGENPTSNEISVYPNPVKNVLNIFLNGTQVVDAEITDLTGRVVLAENNVTNINVNSLPPSVYILKVSTGMGIGYKRIIVE